MMLKKINDNEVLDLGPMNCLKIVADYNCSESRLSSELTLYQVYFNKWWV